MAIPIEPVVGWWTAFSKEDGVIVWRPHYQPPGQPLQRGPYYALSPQSLRTLIKEFEMALAQMEASETSGLQTVRSPTQGQRTG